MIVYKIDHSVSFSQSRVDQDSIDMILRRANKELKVLDSNNSNSISNLLAFGAGLPAIGAKKMYDYYKYYSEKINIYENSFKKIEDAFNNIRCITLREAQINFPNTKECAVGYYTLHPIDSKCLVRMNNYHGVLSEEKDEELIYLLGRMGAHKVKISTRALDKNGHKHEAGFHVPKEVIDADFGAETYSGHHSQYNQQNDRVVEFIGGVKNIDPYLLETSCWFKSDVQLNNIFKSRLTNENRMTSFSYRSTHNNQFDFNFGVAAKLMCESANESQANIEAKLKFEFEKLQNRERVFEVKFVD